MDQQDTASRPESAADAPGRRRLVAPASRVRGALGAPRRTLLRTQAGVLHGWHLLRTHRVLQVAVAMIIVQLAYRSWAMSLSWFTMDDFAFMSRTMNEGIGLSVLFEPYAGHVMPAPMLLSWLGTVIAPYDFLPTAIVIVAMQALANIGLLTLLVRWFGIRRGILPPLALYLFCVISFPVAIWWAAAANQLPLQIVLFFALQTHVSYLRTGRIRHAWFTVAWLLGGFLFYEKTLLVLGAVAIVSLAYFATGSILERLRSLWDRYRAGMVLYIVVGAAYLLVYYRAALNFDPAEATRGGLPDVVANMVFHVYLPALVGGPLKWTAFDQFSLPSTGALAIVVSAALVGLLVREIRRTRSRSLRAWWLPVFFLGCNIVLVVAGRASFVGPLIALDFRYQGELAAVTALALALATMPLRGALERVEVTGTSGFLDRPRRVAAVVVVCSLLGTVSATQYLDRWNEAMPGRPYFTNLIGQIEASDHPYAMVDQQVPNTIMWGLGYPLNLQSHLLKPYTDRDQVRFVSWSVDELRMSTPEGQIRPVGVPVVRSAPPGPAANCGYRIRSRPTEVELDGPLAFGGWWTRLSYYADAPTSMQATVGKADYDIDLPAGLHSLYLRGDGNFDSIELASPTTGRLCVNEVVVGRPETVEVPDDGS